MLSSEYRWFQTDRTLSLHHYAEVTVDDKARTWMKKVARARPRAWEDRAQLAKFQGAALMHLVSEVDAIGGGGGTIADKIHF